MTELIKQDLDAWLDKVDYKYLNSNAYTPTKFALLYLNFINAVNGEDGESNVTPAFHLKALDKLTEKQNQRLINLMFRGAAKTTLFIEYLSVFLAVFRVIPGFGEVPGLLYVSDSMENGVKNARKNIETRWNRSEFLQRWLPKAHFTDNYIEFTNSNNEMFVIKMYGAKTGIRGTKINAKRPVLAILDDLISDADATSRASMDAIENTIYNGIFHALDPRRNKVIWNGTPFNKEDPIIKGVESGGWDVNVWPVCERFPCEKSEFSGAWEERFSYESLLDAYKFAEANGKVAAFMQELMLRITSTTERLVQEEEISWYPRRLLLEQISAYNFYITSDFATSTKQKADDSALSVWAYDNAGNWYWVDGYCERITMGENLDRLFKYVIVYKPQEVGIEVSAQQGAYIDWIQEQMIQKNIYFSFASANNQEAPGIRPDMDKLRRFNLMVPQFKMKKVFYPKEMRDSPTVKKHITQIKLATLSGIKGKDDALDTISMLGYLKPWRPNVGVYLQDTSSPWVEQSTLSATTLSSYIV